MLFFLLNNSESFAQIAPTSPTNFKADPLSATKIHLTWKSPTNNGTAPVTGYKIDFKIPPGDFLTLVDNTGNATTKYTHNNVLVGKTYVYRISAISSAGTSAPIETSAKTSSTLTVTNPPGNLTATSVGPTKIELSWLNPPNYGGPSIMGYKIERKSGSISNFSVLVTNTNSTTTKYVDSTALVNTKSTYRVSAINSIGASNPSNEASSTPTPQSAPPKVITTTNKTTSNVSTKPIGDPISAAKAEMQKKIEEGLKQLPDRSKKTDSEKAKTARAEAQQLNEKAKQDALVARQKLVAEKQAALKAVQEKPTRQTVTENPAEPKTKKPKTLEEARKLAEEAKQKALEKANIDAKPKEDTKNKAQQELAAAKAAAWEKARKALEAEKAKKANP